MPAVTVPPNPKGLPTAMTQSPTCSLSEAPRHCRQGMVGIDLEERQVGALVAANQLGLVSLAIIECDADLCRLADDVVIGDDIAGWIDDETGAEGVLHHRASLTGPHLAVEEML